MVTIKEVAEKAKVSPATVSRVINNPSLVNPKTRARVQEVLNAMMYIPNLNGPALLKSKSNTLALIIPDITNPFFTSLARAFQDVAQQAGWTVFIGNTDDDPTVEGELIRSVIGHRVDGIALAPVGGASLKSVEVIKRYQVPLVFIDRYVPGAEDVNFILGNDYSGIDLLVNHLYSFGHRRIALITGLEGMSTADRRYEAYIKACQERGVPVHEPYVVRVPYKIEEGQKAAENLMLTRPRPTAIVCANNFVALGCIRYLYSIGIRIPEDISVVSFDDIEHLALIHPFLTVVAQPTQRMGRLAARLLIDSLQSQSESKSFAEYAQNGSDATGDEKDVHEQAIQQIEITPELIVRRSAGPPKS